MVARSSESVVLATARARARHRRRPRARRSSPSAPCGCRAHEGLADGVPSRGREPFRHVGGADLGHGATDGREDGERSPTPPFSSTRAFQKASPSAAPAASARRVSGSSDGRPRVRGRPGERNGRRPIDEPHRPVMGQRPAHRLPFRRELREGIEARARRVGAVVEQHGHRGLQPVAADVARRSFPSGGPSIRTTSGSSRSSAATVSAAEPGP